MDRKTAHSGRSALALLAGFLTLAAGVLTPGAAVAQPSARWQLPATIAAAARDAALAADAGEVETVGVDSRLKLAECSAALDARLERPIVRGHGTVTVSCSGPSPWRLFVPVRTTQELAVLVLVRNAQAGEVLTPADLKLERRSAASLPLGFLSAVEQAAGFTLRRAQIAGTVLVPAALERPEVVARGALVTVIAGTGPITVKSDGIALDSARLGERIRVRSPSGRVVEGTAEGPGQVRVGT
jgi:flagella basal body P-ring formation protein FlgA